MKSTGALVFFGLGWLLRQLARLLIVTGEAMIGCAKPLLWVSDRCLDKAAEWDPRLAERDQPLDPSPPPRS